MATKKYTARMGFSITVLVDGKRKHICFEGLSNGCSQFITDDKKVQKELEARSSYGEIFTGREITLLKKEKTSSKKEGGVSPEKKKVTVGSIADAKEYLVTYHGMSNTKLRSKASILAAAEENNVEFIGI